MKFLVITVLVAFVGITAASPADISDIADIAGGAGGAGGLLDLSGITKCVTATVSGLPSNATVALNDISNMVPSNGKITIIIDPGVRNISLSSK